MLDHGMLMGGRMTEGSSVGAAVTEASAVDEKSAVEGDEKEADRPC